MEGEGQALGVQVPGTGVRVPLPGCRPPIPLPGSAEPAALSGGRYFGPGSNAAPIFSGAGVKMDAAPRGFPRPCAPPREDRGRRA